METQFHNKADNGKKYHQNKSKLTIYKYSKPPANHQALSEARPSACYKTALTRIPERRAVIKSTTEATEGHTHR